MNGKLTVKTPDWVKHAVFYQIFPDRFARGARPDNPDLVDIQFEGWESPPSLQGYKGGNLWGVTNQLDYLQGLGVTAIYFTPIFQSASNHRYHTHDYYQVDPILGGNPAFFQMLEAAHHRGIKVVLDGVFNHASRGFFFFHDILENGPYSPWVNWFKIQGWPLSPYNGEHPANYVGWDGNRALPEFNHANPQVREYIMEIGEYWVRSGIDGWRLDVPFCIQESGFWQEFRDRIKAINPEAYIVGEVWRDARQWLDGTQFDGVMNYLFTAPTIAFVAGNRVIPEMAEDRSYEPYPAIDANDYAAKMQRLLKLYPWEIQLTQLNLLASHDTARLLSMANGDVDSVKLANLLLLTFPGAPSIYYGDEVGLLGGLDPDSRRGFPLQADWNLDLLTCHRQLIALRHAHPALRTGNYQILGAEGMMYAFARIGNGEALIVAINAGETSAKITLDGVDGKLSHHPSELLYGTGEVHWAGESLTLDLPGRSGIVLG